MDPELYAAAQLGNWVVMESFSDKFYSQHTPEKNTVLHVLAHSCDSANVVQLILAGHSLLLMKKNKRGETALYLAASKGHLGVVRELIHYAKSDAGYWFLPGLDRCKRMLRMASEDRNTALHVAVKNNFYDVAKLLVQADPEFQYPINYAMETPLYVAVEKGYQDIADLILMTCNSPSYLGPCFKTALHAAAICNSPELIKAILKKQPGLTQRVDVSGWTALHYAAELNHQEVVQLLLSADRSTAYVAARNDYSSTALHIAVIHGHVAVVEELLSHCPDCWEKCTSKRQNILHLAVKYEQREVLEFVLQKPWASELINQKDDKGNTPLHLYIATNELIGSSLVNHSCLDINAFNTTNFTPLDNIIRVGELTKRQESIRDELKRAGGAQGYRNVPRGKKNLQASENIHEAAKLDQELSGNYLIVATLIATVTFAAGITIPGGYNGADGPNKGLAVLGKKAAFTAFVISDSLALMLSMGAVIVLLVQVDSTFQTAKLNRRSNTGLWIFGAWFHWISLMRTMIFGALIFMSIAFVTGLFAVVQSLILKILLCVPAAYFCYWIPTSLGFLVLYYRASGTGADSAWLLGPLVITSSSVRLKL